MSLRSCGCDVSGSRPTRRSAKNCSTLGRYMLTEDGRREMAKAIAAAFSVMEQGLQQMSEAMAERFGVPQRDAHHALAKSFRAVRAVQAERFRQQADAEPVHVEDVSG
jgi:hypothetical protein